jgi:hypothetical protein
MDERFDRVDERIDSVRNAIVFGATTMSSAFVAGLIAFALQG